MAKKGETSAEAPNSNGRVATTTETRELLREFPYYHSLIITHYSLTARKSGEGAELGEAWGSA